eukprot:4013753-Alexandrium_andersonii.AAC.1
MTDDDPSHSIDWSGDDPSRHSSHYTSGDEQSRRGEHSEPGEDQYRPGNRREWRRDGALGGCTPEEAEREIEAGVGAP